jgi:hypothetical protein
MAPISKEDKLTFSTEQNQKFTEIERKVGSTAQKTYRCLAEINELIENKPPQKEKREELKRLYDVQCANETEFIEFGRSYYEAKEQGHGHDSAKK